MRSRRRCGREGRPHHLLEEVGGRRLIRGSCGRRCLWRTGDAGVGSAGGDDVDLRVETANDGEELKAGHAGHVEVGEKDVGDGGADHLEGGKAVFSGADGKAAHGEDLCKEVARVDFVFDDEQVEVGLRHKKSFLSGGEEGVSQRCHGGPRELSVQNRTERAAVLLICGWAHFFGCGWLDRDGAGALIGFNGWPFGIMAAELIVEDDVEQGFVDADAAVVLDEAELAKAVHEEADAGAGGADHFGEGFLGDGGDEGFGFAGLAEFGHEEEGAGEAFFAGVEELVDEVGLGLHAAGEEEVEEEVGEGRGPHGGPGSSRRD